MSSSKKFRRKEFIKIALLSSTGLYFNACGVGNNPGKKDIPAKDNIAKDSIINNVKDIQPTYKLYKKGDEQYEAVRKGFNKRIDKFPAAIAMCTSTEEVAQAVNYGIKNKLSICLKSGGHSFEGFSSNNDGLVINLSSMNEIKWENDSVISVGPGCQLSQLYDAVLPKNKLLPAGSCGSVGIGGLTLGGGYGLFSREYGLTCDSLTEITMVNGKGAIINSKDDPELLWACKGGGNGSFGVITSMKFSLTDSPGFLQSHRFKIKLLDASRAVNILEQWFALTANLPLSCFSAFVLNGSSLYILLTNSEAYTPDSQKIIDALISLTDKVSLGKRIPLSKAVKTFYGVMHPVYFKNASAGFYKNFEDIKNCIEDVIKKVIQTPGMIYQVNTLGGKINDDTLAKNSSYSHRDKNYLSELQTYWNEASRSTGMIKTFEEVQQIFSANGIQSQYSNYPDINFKDWENAYYGNNYKRLQKVKDTYDPQNCFSSEQSIKTNKP